MDPALIGEYCRAIERHLCQKNDGHLIRIVGPAFVLVSEWERQGVPLKVALKGIDRCVERYQRTRARRRPVRVEFCDTDVREVFDEWRRAVGLAHSGAPAPGSNGDPALGLEADLDVDHASGSSPEPGEPGRERRGPSLKLHLERAALRLSSARVTGRIGATADPVLDRLSNELDRARAAAGGLRGEARRALIDRLSSLDRELATAALDALDSAGRAAIEAEAREALQPFRRGMTADGYDRALRRAVDRLVRERTGLPVLEYS